MTTRRQLEIFLAAAQLGGVGRAARSLRISQPSASRQVASLETKLGGKLFARRHGTAPVLTEFGRSMIPAAQEMLELQMQMENRNRPALDQESVKVFARRDMLERMAGLAEPLFLPGGRLQPEFEALQDMQALLDLIRADPAVFGFFHDMHLPQDANCEFTILGLQPCGLYVAADHPVMRNGPPEDLNDLDWLVPDGPERLEYWMRQMLVMNGAATDRIVTAAPSTDAILGQVLAGAGGGILMDSHVRERGASSCVIKLPRMIAPFYVLLAGSRVCDPRVRKELAERLTPLAR